MKSMTMVAIVLGAAGLVLLGRCTAPRGARESGASTAASQPPAEAKAEVWTCPMHPEVRQPRPGSCPKCGMDLVLQTDDTGPRQLAMSPDAVKLAGIQTAPVERRFVTMPVRIVGKVEYDETRVRTIAARVAGRLDRLYVDYTGISVKEGDHLVWLYSPELLEAQQELLEAKKRLHATKEEPSEFLADSNRRGYQSAREKLLLWGLSLEQVDEIEARGTAEDHMMIRSPSSGVVVHKDLTEGDYVKEGTPIYRIADLSHLWVRLDAYEQDLPWLRYGQTVTVQTEAYPGRVFEGWISFLDPVVSETTRTVKVRVNIANADGLLKPGMFVRGVVQSRLGDEGAVVEPRLAGKWISPMHPEIVKDGPGTCDVCGMDLVPAAELGFVDEEILEKPLVVPVTAVLVAGTRGVVYVEVPGEKPTFEGREVILGPRAGDFYIVRAGLSEKDRVVVNGAFRIDSSMQIRAKRSMMTLAGDADTYTGPSTAVLRASLEPVYDAYLGMQKALSADDADAARQSSGELGAALAEVRAGGLSREARARWQEEAEVLGREAQAIAEGASLVELREHFSTLSRSVLTLERTFRHVGATRYHAFCPMAFDNQGGSWLQGSGELANPYFGSSMLKCGEIREEWPGVEQQVQSATQESPPLAPERATPEPKKEPEEKQEQEQTPPATVDLSPVYQAYFTLQASLAKDDAERASSALAGLHDAVAGVDESALAAPALGPWNELAAAVAASRDLRSLEPQRTAFQRLSDSLLAVHDAAGHGGSATFYRVHCPMAFGDTGADWLQRDKVVANPYFGASMLRCGSIESELPGRGEGR